jgi:hypothetical protein
MMDIEEGITEKREGSKNSNGSKDRRAFLFYQNGKD